MIRRKGLENLYLTDTVEETGARDRLGIMSTCRSGDVCREYLFWDQNLSGANDPLSELVNQASSCKSLWTGYTGAVLYKEN